MKSFILISLLTFALGNCAEKTVNPQQSESLTIRTGTSFGFCVGYCAKDYVVTATTITLTQRSPQNQNPDKTCQTTIAQADWNALKANADFTTFSKQPATLGCPDCADGGAEYIELQQGDARYRVVFEYGKTIPGFETLVTALRTRRAAFATCQ